MKRFTNSVKSHFRLVKFFYTRPVVTRPGWYKSAQIDVHFFLAIFVLDMKTQRKKFENLI